MSVIPRTEIPNRYLSKRVSLGFDSVTYGGCGFELYKAEDLEAAQEEYGAMKGWRDQWIAIGHEMLFGDPIVIDRTEPHRVFRALAAPGMFGPAPASPSLAIFWDCLAIFRKFAAGRETFEGERANEPTEEEIERFKTDIRAASGDDEDAFGFWTLHAGIDIEEEDDEDDNDLM